MASVETLRAAPPGNPASTEGRTVEDLFAQEADALGAAPQSGCRELAFDFDQDDGHPLSKSSGTALGNVADGSGGWTVFNFIRR